MSPYIAQQSRDILTSQLRTRDESPQYARRNAKTAGELTWQLTVVVEQYRKANGDSFQTFADIVAALEQAKDEFRRRVIHPYEDEKKETNGDCYAPRP